MSQFKWICILDSLCLFYVWSSWASLTEGKGAESGLRLKGIHIYLFHIFISYIFPHFSDWCGLIFWQALVLETLLGAPPRSEITTALSNLSTPSNRSRWGWGWWWRHLTCWGRRWWWCWRWRWCRRGWAWWCQGGGRRSRAARGTWRCPSSSRLLHRVAGRRSWGWLWLQWWWWWPLHHDDVWWWCGVCVCVTENTSLTVSQWPPVLPKWSPDDMNPSELIWFSLKKISTLKMSDSIGSVGGYLRSDQFRDHLTELITWLYKLTYIH